MIFLCHRRRSVVCAPRQQRQGRSTTIGGLYWVTEIEVKRKALPNFCYPMEVVRGDEGEVKELGTKSTIGYYSIEGIARGTGKKC